MFSVCSIQYLCLSYLTHEKIIENRKRNSKLTVTFTNYNNLEEFFNMGENAAIRQINQNKYGSWSKIL